MDFIAKQLNSVQYKLLNQEKIFILLLNKLESILKISSDGKKKDIKEKYLSNPSINPNYKNNWRNGYSI